MTSVILSTQGVTRRFGGLVAVEDVTFNVRKNEVFGVIGPNGAGKSTLFNLISAALKPTSGTIEFEGKRIDGHATYQLARRGMARTFQNVRLFGDQSVLENVMLGAYRRTPSGILSGLLGAVGGHSVQRRQKEQALRWLQFVSLDKLADRRADDLSFGQQRLLELARALALEPTLLLLDEPASGLNDKETSVFADLVKGLKQFGITILIVEHNMDLMMRVADRIVVLDRGRRIAEGTPLEIQADPRVISVYLGTGADA